MDIYTEIRNALDGLDNRKILNFGDYKIMDIIDAGQQGMVMQAENRIGKQFAIKFYKPTDTNPGILKASLVNFKREVSILADLNHKNIVGIYSGGNAVWSSSNSEWEVKSGFNSKHKLAANEVAYYLMDYIKGIDTDSIFPILKHPEDDQLVEYAIPEYKRVIMFEEMVTQISIAMAYYHKKGVTHKDIKPKNIRFCEEDNTFVLVDFGFARNLSSPVESEVFEFTEFRDFPSLDRNDYKKNDMGQFSLMLRKLLPTLKNEYTTKRYEGLEQAITKGCHADLDERFVGMEEFFNTVKQNFINEPGWKFQLKLDEYLTPDRFGRFSSYVRNPVSGSILLTEDVTDIIDTQEFQRLRGVRQLGPTMFVFPGANHTRFEHSLGTYDLTLKFLKQLLAFPRFRELCDPIDESIKLMVLAALLHDIGHYPYSHWIEEIDSWPRGVKFPHHEDRAMEIIGGGEIGEVIETGWRVDLKLLGQVITGKGAKGRTLMMNSIINSIIDVDKLDYLVRDSVHCGVSYGTGIDVERLLNSLHIVNTSDKICLTEKGRSALLSIISCRNIMYQEIYWHKTVRACDAMFKRFMFEYIKAQINSISEIKPLFYKSDDEFINTLYNRAAEHKRKGYKGEFKLERLISPFAYKGRKLYKPLRAARTVVNV